MVRKLATILNFNVGPVVCVNKDSDDGDNLDFNAQCHCHDFTWPNNNIFESNYDAASLLEVWAVRLQWQR